jgi:HKD family nuclease
MLTEAELIIQPYSSKDGKSLLDVLIGELKSGRWVRFQAAVAFLRSSGNFRNLLEAMHIFVAEGGTIEITFGADIFAGNTRGTDYEAVKLLLSEFKKEPRVKFYLYHERGRTFHPKVYLFANEQASNALLIVGSSNWSDGGLVNNIEANVLLKLQLDKEDHRQCYQLISEYFSAYWTEVG